MRILLLIFYLGLNLVTVSLAAQAGVRERPTTMVLPPVRLKGSDESQRWQNYMADIENLSRIENHGQLLVFEKKGLLVPLPETETIVLDPRLKITKEYCYARPWTCEFLEDLGKAYHRKFPTSVFQINSAVRDRVRQKDLQKKNANAAAIYGPKASSHLTGATVDITKRNMGKAQVVWMRRELFKFAKRRQIWVTEESFNQTVFHIMVFSSYRAKKEIKK